MSVMWSVDFTGNRILCSRSASQNYEINIIKLDIQKVCQILQPSVIIQPRPRGALG